jgi:putative tricarboxylic transport membrane protein
MRRADAVGAVLLAAIGAYAALKARSFGLGVLSQPGAGFFPFWAGVLIVVCACAIMAHAFAHRSAAAASDLDDQQGGRGANWGKVACCVGVLLGYAVALPLIGFGPSTFVVMLALSRLDSSTTWPGSFVIAAVGASAFWLLFARGLAVNFPHPALGF